MFSLWEEESFTLFQRVCFPHVSILCNYACRAIGQQRAYITGSHKKTQWVQADLEGTSDSETIASTQSCR